MLLSSAGRAVIGRLIRDVGSRTIFEQLERDQSDDRGDQNVDRDRIAGPELVDQPGRDESGGAAGDDRRELIPQACSRVDFDTADRPRVSSAVVKSSRSGILIDTIRDVYTRLGFDVVDDEAFFQLVAARLVEPTRSEEHTSELQSRGHLVCRLLLEKKKTESK